MEWLSTNCSGEFEDPVEGGAGGGMERSTGEGVSPGTSPVMIELRDTGLIRLAGAADAGNSGVELAERVPRRLDFLLFNSGGMDGVMRFGGAA